MHDQQSLPAGAYLDRHWVETGHRDLGLIAVPDRSEPVMVEWTRYACPGTCHGAEYRAVFWHGSRRLKVREGYDQVVVDGGVRYCRRSRHASAEGACATELVLALAAGRELTLERIERGAYTGLWRGDVHTVSRWRRGRLETMTCRVVLDLDRDRVRLFRRRALVRRAREPSPR